MPTVNDPNNSPRAQTTPDASFEPVFIATPFHRRVVRSLQSIYAIIISYHQKNLRNNKKNSPRAQTTPDASFEPVFIATPFHRHVVRSLQSIHAIVISYYQNN
jgi:hypothetical protein